MTVEVTNDPVGAGLPSHTRRRALVVVAVVVAAVIVVGAAAFVWYDHRVRTGSGPLGSSARIGLTSCSPARPGDFIAAESIWLSNASRSRLMIESITLEHPRNVTVLGFYVDDIASVGATRLSPGNAWAPTRSGVAALHAPSAIGYSVPARTAVPQHALRAAVEPIDPAQQWSYSGLTIRYRAGGLSYRLDAHTALVIPPLHHPCTDASLDPVGH